MNMAYAPHKAISLKIASAVFHNVSMYGKHGDVTRFDSFRISYPDDLAEWVTGEKFFYSNNTSSQPSDLSNLKEIAGCGSSPLVKYGGTGAYFLDKLSDGVWRLEVMPDAYWIADPYSPANPGMQKAAVLHTSQQMTVSLPDLGANFAVRPVNKGNLFCQQASDGQMDLVPGVYILKRSDITYEIPSDLKYKSITLAEFVAPESNLVQAVLWNHSPGEAVAGKPLQLHFEAVSPYQVKKIEVALSMQNRWKTLAAVQQGTNSYIADVPEDMVRTGFLDYRIIIEDGKEITSFPGGRKGDPWSWVNRNSDTYTIRLVPEGSPLILWDAGTDWGSTYKMWSREVNLKPTGDGGTALAVQLDQLPEADPVDRNDRCYAFKFFFGEKIKGRSDELPQKKSLAIKVSNLLPSSQPIEIGLIDRNGTVLAGKINIKKKGKVFKIPLDSFAGAPFIVLPRPYPDFLPFKVQSAGKPFDWSSAEALQLIVRPGTQANTDLYIERIWLE
jgi:hypothetical protein